MFAQLALGRSTFYAPRGFWGAFKDYDGSPIDVKEHQDAYEFFTRLQVARPRLRAVWLRAVWLYPVCLYAVWLHAAAVSCGHMLWPYAVGVCCGHAGEASQPLLVRQIDCECAAWRGLALVSRVAHGRRACTQSQSHVHTHTNPLRVPVRTRSPAPCMQDCVDQHLLGSGQRPAIKPVMGGVFVQQIICRGLDYTSERVDDFYQISVDVKGLGSLERSLDDYVKVRRRARVARGARVRQRRARAHAGCPPCR